MRCRLAPEFVSALLLLLIFAAAFPAAARQNPKRADAQSAEHTPDLSGVWMGSMNVITFGSGDPSMLPWAQKKFLASKPGYGPRATPDSQDPILKCFPPGVPRIMLIPFPMRIIQIPGQVIMLFEYDHFIRHIFLNRKHPKELNPTWMGDSVGRWEGDTLVVDTVGFNDKTWLDQVGHPHTGALHVIERIRRIDHYTLQDEVTIEDPKTYTRPWGGKLTFKLRPGWHLMEYICEDNMAEDER